MSASLSTKRRRTNTIDASVSGPDSAHLAIAQIIKALPLQTVQDFLTVAAAQHPDIAVLILNENKNLIAAQRARVIDFDHYSKLAWKVINVTYRGLSGSKQYERSFEATSEVMGYIEAIRENSTIHASYDTKKNALETLRKIGKTICLSGGTIGHEVRMQFQGEDCLEGTMLAIAASMTLEERARVLTQEFESKLEELEGLANDQFLFEKLKDVRGILSGEQESEDEIDEDENEDEEQEDDEVEDEGNDEGDTDDEASDG